MIGKIHTCSLRLFTATILFCSTPKLRAQNNITVQWEHTLRISKSTPTLQVVVNPMLERGSPIHEGSFKALKDLEGDFVRFVPWFPYPHMAVPELKAPTKTGTFWDFSNIDPIVEDFMQATRGHSTVMNFSTIPTWMFKIDKLADYPADKNEVFWPYNEGTELRDSTIKELTDYFVRVFSWYTQGGFTDELGKFHKSGYHYKFPYWEVLNEPDLEHGLSPQVYTRVYDRVVLALKKLSPDTKFIGISMAYENAPEWFEYFLNPANHQSGVPLEGISYHFYGTPDYIHQPLDVYQFSFFNQVEGFLSKVRYIENIRKRLAPKTFTTINEIGNILGDQTGDSIAAHYWNLSGAMFAYLYVELAKIGIDVAGESQLVGYPTQFPSVSLMNWKTGKPNARYWVLKLLKDNFGAGDTLFETQGSNGNLLAQAFSTKWGKKLLVINKRNEEIQLVLPEGFNNAETSTVDIATQDNPPRTGHLDDRQLTLQPFAVSVISLKD